MKTPTDNHDESLQVVHRYCVRDGWIKVERVEEPKIYYPLSERDDYLERHKRSKPIDPLPLVHTDLMHLDCSDTEAIEDFCNKWGTLGIYRNKVVLNHRNIDMGKFKKVCQAQGIEKESQLIKLAHHFEMWESISEFTRECWAYQETVRLVKAIRPLDNDKISDLLKSGKYKRWLTPGTILSNAPYQFAQRIFEKINNHRESITSRFVVIKDGKSFIPKEIAVSHSLLSSLYEMLLRSFTDDTFFRNCGHCRKAFETKDSRQKFCCSRHQSSSTSAKNYARKKERIQNG